jgi:hypothetical protein
LRVQVPPPAVWNRAAARVAFVISGAMSGRAAPCTERNRSRSWSTSCGSSTHGSSGSKGRSSFIRLFDAASNWRSTRNYRGATLSHMTGLPPLSSCQPSDDPIIHGDDAPGEVLNRSDRHTGLDFNHRDSCIDIQGLIQDDLAGGIRGLDGFLQKQITSARIAAPMR